MPTVTTQSERRRRRSKARQARRRKRRKRREHSLPGWGDLSFSKGARSREGGFLASLSTVRFALVVLVLAGACALYVGHVHATQRLLSQVQEERQENRRLHLKNRRLQSTFNQATAPSVIYRRAEELGLEESFARGPVIHVTPRSTP